MGITPLEQYTQVRKWLLVSGMATAVGACGFASPQRSATIEGDVYVVMQNGDTKRGAGLTVRLANADSAQAPIVASCAAFQHHIEQSLPAITRMTKEAEFWLTRAQEAVVYSTSTSRAYRDSSTRYLDSSKAVIRGDSVAEVTMMAANAAILDGRGRARSAQSGIKAHYRFGDVAAGRYLLQADWPIGSQTYRWLVPVAVTGEGIVTKDLDNNALQDHICLRAAKATPARSW